LHVYRRPVGTGRSGVARRLRGVLWRQRNSNPYIGERISTRTSMSATPRSLGRCFESYWRWICADLFVVSVCAHLYEYSGRFVLESNYGSNGKFPVSLGDSSTSFLVLYVRDVIDRFDRLADVAQVINYQQYARIQSSLDGAIVQLSTRIKSLA